MGSLHDIAYRFRDSQSRLDAAINTLYFSSLRRLVLIRDVKALINDGAIAVLVLIRDVIVIYDHPSKKELINRKNLTGVVVSVTAFSVTAVSATVSTTSHGDCRKLW